MIEMEGEMQGTYTGVSDDQHVRYMFKSLPRIIYIKGKANVL